jgi:tetratricopeptide (TPR) repeat protein
VVLLAMIRQDYRKARLKTVDHFRPRSFAYLQAIEKEPALARPARVMQYITYYRKVLKVVPEREDIYNVMGFCYFHLGRTEDAIAYYLRAAQLNPEFFWPHYNLGVVFFKTGRYQEAAIAFKQAMEKSPDLTMLVISASDIYRDIGAETPSPARQRGTNLEDVYNKVPILMILSHYAASKDGSRAIEIKQETENLRVYLF